MSLAEKILPLAKDGNIEKIIELCKHDILETSLKEKGGSSLVQRTKAAQGLLKNVEEYYIEKCGACIKNGYQMFNNRTIGFMLYEPLEGLPQGTDTKATDISAIIDNIKGAELTSISFNLLKIYYKQQKAENKGKKNYIVRYAIGNKEYNAELLLKCYEILGGDNIKFYQNDNDSRHLQYAYFESENGKAVICPLKPQGV